jgi:trehalose/maltose hydrolase-like predicted phosphorylase
MNGRNATMNGKSHMKKSIETERLLCYFNYYRFTGDYSYIPEKGLEVLIGIARFWHQRANF